MDSKKIKKIEFSDTIKHNGSKGSKDLGFTYSEVDKLVFGEGSKKQQTSELREIVDKQLADMNPYSLGD